MSGHYWNCRAGCGSVHITSDECGRCGTPRFPTRGTWRVQVGKGKGAYDTRYSFEHDAPVRTVKAWYEGVNVHSGHKKRLLDPYGNVVERELT